MSTDFIKKIYKAIKYFSFKSLFIKLKIFKHIKYINKYKDIYIMGNTVFDLKKDSKILVNGDLYLNNNKLPNSKSEVLLQMCSFSKLIINDNFSVGYGSDFLIKENAILELNGGYCNSNVEIRCGNHIVIGKNCAIARGVKILDSDFHTIYDEKDNIINKSEEVIIGDNVWIGTGVTILKGVTIGNNSIIGADSVVTGTIPDNSIAVGNPARIIKQGIRWIGNPPPNEKDVCTGCGACFNICPKEAITMQGDKYGFYKPVIDKEKCINCGLCEKICPLDNYKSQNSKQPKVFAFQNDDKEILYKCASGGAFAKLADYVIRHDGIVYGVVYDENMVVCHSRTDNLTDLGKMLSSKYVQSDTKDTFKQAKEDLENGKLVLFSGTPCQIAGLKSFLQKDYENLITVDLVCHGVPSPLVFEKYKQEFMAKQTKDEKLINIDFRSKVKGWSPELLTTISTTTKVENISAQKDCFMSAFLSNLSINSSCLDCQFNRLPCIADLSLADFWGVDEYDKSLNDSKGLSLVLINSVKGSNLIEQIEGNCLLKKVPLDYAIKCNPNICGSSKPHPKRTEFLEYIKRGKSLQYCVKKYCGESLHIRIYRLLPQFVKDFIKYKILKREKC